MANTKISAFTSGAPAEATDEFVIARAGANYKLAGSDLKTLAVGAGAVSVTSAKTLTVSNTLTLAGTDGSTLNVGAGGTLGALATVTPGTGVATAAANAVNGSGGLITYATFAPASGKTLTLSNSFTLAGTDSTTMTFPPITASIGFLNIPLVGGAAKTTGYTGVLADAGQMVIMNGSSITFTIPANGSVAYAVGTVLTVVNINSTALSIAITTDTLTLAGSTTTGTRSLVQNGIATCLKVSSTGWLINGIGLS